MRRKQRSDSIYCKPPCRCRVQREEQQDDKEAEDNGDNTERAKNSAAARRRRGVFVGRLGFHGAAGECKGCTSSNANAQ